MKQMTRDELTNAQRAALDAASRQMLFELAQLGDAGAAFAVVMAPTSRQKIIVATTGELLPMGVGPADLNIEPLAHA